MSKGGWSEFNDPIKTIGNDTQNSVPAKGNRQVRLERTRSGKKGKLVTVITGLELNQGEAKKLLKKLKIACGTGGTVKGDFLELQGDQILKAQDFLVKEGFRPKQSGG
jgi:translation initiation factor 1